MEAEAAKFGKVGWSVIHVAVTATVTGYAFTKNRKELN